MTGQEPTCQELVELVTDYLEGVLPPGDSERFEAHLADCVDCTAYLEQMGQTILALGRLPVEAVNPAALAELESRFRDWRTGY